MTTNDALKKAISVGWNPDGVAVASEFWYDEVKRAFRFKDSSGHWATLRIEVALLDPSFWGALAQVIRNDDPLGMMMKVASHIYGGGTVERYFENL